MKLLFITGNPGKMTAMQHIIPGLEQRDIELDELQDINPHAVTIHKAKQAQQHTKLPFIIEDSYLTLDCLNGLPGPLIKWFEKTIGIEGIAKICDDNDNHMATAGVVIGYSDDQQDIHIFEGTMRGTISQPKGDNGFGFDPIFTPLGHTQTYGQMTFEEKSSISQRTIATNKLKAYLSK